MKSPRTIRSASIKKPYYRCPECRQRAIAKEYSLWQRKVVVGGSAVADGLRAVASTVTVADFSALTEETKTAVVCHDTSTQTDDVEPEPNVGRRDFWTQTDHVKASHAAVQTDEGFTGTVVVESSAPVRIEPAAVEKGQKPVVAQSSDAAVTELSTRIADLTIQDEPKKKSTLANTMKYWKRRYSLFSRFDEGVMLDEVSFYSVCPEVLASHMARRCAYDCVVDPFCGAGGNAIQLALTCCRVIAVDIDPAKIKLARRNAEVYGVAEKIDFRVGNCFDILNEVRAEAVVTSPPWGGPRYSRRFNAKDLGSREMGGMAGILKMARNIAFRVVLHVPKTIDRKQCLDVSRKENFGLVEIEDVSIDGRKNCTNLYLKLQQDYRQLGPAIQSKVDLESGVQNGWSHILSGLSSCSLYLTKTKAFLTAK